MTMKKVFICLLVTFSFFFHHGRTLEVRANSEMENDHKMQASREVREWISPTEFKVDDQIFEASRYKRMNYTPTKYIEYGILPNIQEPNADADKDDAQYIDPVDVEEDLTNLSPSITDKRGAGLKHIGIGRRGSGLKYIGIGKRDDDDDDDKRGAGFKHIGIGKRSAGLKYIGIGRRGSGLKYVGIGKREEEKRGSGLKYIGIGRRSAGHKYIGIGRRGGSGLKYIGIGKRTTD